MAKGRASSWPSRLSVLTAALISIYAHHSIAATTTYTGVWAGGTIAPDETVVLNDGASVAGNVLANGTLQFNQSGTNLLVISSTISGTGTLSLTNTGALNLTGTSSGSNVIVLDLNTTASAGLLQAQTGTGVLRIGSSGTGMLNVTGGRVSNRDGFLGVNAGGIGTATVSSGTWANGGSIIVGSSGIGTLNVTGGLVSNGGGSLGVNADGIGTATVSSGTWASRQDLYVGYGGTGTLNVTGGLVSSAAGILGSKAASVGTVTVASGTWANSGFLSVGEYGNGTLNVTGGSVTNSDAVLGWWGGGVGVATVSSGTWASTGALYLGGYVTGVGALNVTGGHVTSTFGLLGANAGTAGTATVSGGTWANSGNLIVGSSGTGTLSVSSGGLVIVGGALSKGTSGTINLDAGGTLQIGTGGTTGVLGTNLTNNGTLIFNRLDDASHSLIISGSGTFGKQGAGTLLLSATNTLTGPIFIESGGIAIANHEGLSQSSRIVLAPATTFDVTRVSDTYEVPSGQTIAGSGTILGSVTFGRGSTLSPGAFSTGIQGAGAAVGVTQILTVPEPATIGLVGVGLGLLGLGALRRKRAA
jgi:fibronectin-binding autotransporter adhesin